MPAILPHRLAPEKRPKENVAPASAPARAIAGDRLADGVDPAGVGGRHGRGPGSGIASLVPFKTRLAQDPGEANKAPVPSIPPAVSGPHPKGRPYNKASTPLPRKSPNVPTQRLRISFVGTVQGVGFRATACHVAGRYALTGWVKNEPDRSVLMEVQGQAAQIDAFLGALRERMGRLITSEHPMPIATVEGETALVVRR